MPALGIQRSMGPGAMIDKSIGEQEWLYPFLVGTGAQLTSVSQRLLPELARQRTIVCR